MSTAEPAAPAAKPKKQRNAYASIQKFGRSLMLPIAALPVASLMLRLGQADMLGKDGLGWGTAADVIAAGGGALFDNLPLLFAVGIAIGMAKKADGSTALAAVVGYLVFKSVGDTMSPSILGAPKDASAKQDLINWGVLGGVVSGLIAAKLWERFYRTKLPPYLAFFGGRRLVPILTAFATLIASVLMAFLYKGFETGLTSVSKWVAHHEVIGGFVYGTLNRLLIPTGTHHILNSIPWFQLGSYETGGKTYQGDIARFLNGDPTAGSFMTGFFPIMMFALPAAALAMWQEARPDQRKVVGGVLGSTALCAFLTGVTEPLEFAFMFIAWPLYVVHAVLTGTSIALCNALGVRDGFGFSAGLFDYVLNFGIATKPLLIVAIGLGYAAVYYVVFRWVIRRWNLRTPGREESEQDSLEADTAA